MYNTRYWFIKKVYPNYLLLFKTSKNKLGYRSYDNDKRLLDYFRNYCTNIHIVTKRLEKSNVNYILIDNDTSIIKIYKSNNNMYITYLYRSILKNGKAKGRAKTLPFEILLPSVNTPATI